MKQSLLIFAVALAFSAAANAQQSSTPAQPVPTASGPLLVQAPVWKPGHWRWDAEAQNYVWAAGLYLGVPGPVAAAVPSR